MKLGFVGLGRMGKPMAVNLLKSGAELIVANRSPGPLTEFAAQGARATSDYRECAAADIVFLCLPSAEVVTDVLFGENGIADSLRPGHTVVDTSTITHSATMDHARELERRGVFYLDAPVSGMEARARDATLTIMCGGEQETFDSVKPYLDCMGSNILFMGGTGSGQLAKLVNQLLFDINAAALAEILPMSCMLGLDPVKVAAIVNNGTGRSYASEFFLPRILDGGFDAGYPMQAAYKDLVSAAELAVGLRIPLPVLAAATTTYQLALLRGYGDHDKGGMIRVFEELLDVRFRREQVEPSNEEPS